MKLTRVVRIVKKKSTMKPGNNTLGFIFMRTFLMDVRRKALVVKMFHYVSDFPRLPEI